MSSLNQDKVVVVKECRMIVGYLVAAFLASSLAWPKASAAGVVTESDSLARGHALFVSKGCYECHGYVGQGSIMSGATIAPEPISFPAMAAYIRAPKGQMPPYSKKILSDAELLDIHTYLESIPANPKLETIALLKENGPPAAATSQTASVQGGVVFAANCAACHGASGEGGVGPVLRGIVDKRGIDGIAAFVRSPAGAMPRLYPTVLSEQDVKNVARYVATLR
jgi:ubiquinol-cytochrome c reductase cytochrome c subunit